MRKLLLIFLCLPLLFTTCKKEESAIEIEEEPTIYNAWQLSMQSTYSGIGDFFVTAAIVIDGTIYTGQIQYIDSGLIMVSSDTITLFTSRIWSINENQSITDTYYDENGFAYDILQHNFTKNLDTLVVSFQSGDIKKFVINKLTTDQFHITSIADTNYTPLIDANGIYQDTVLINATSYTYFFDVIQ